jgi:hypothetical protein
MINLYSENGIKVIAIDHNVYLYPHFNFQDKYKLIGFEIFRHNYYPRASAVVALSAFDQLIWNRAGVKSRFIPNPATSEMHNSSSSNEQNILFIGRMAP